MWVYDEDYVDYSLLTLPKEDYGTRILSESRGHKAFYRDERLKFVWKVHKIFPNGNFILKIDFD